MLGILNPFITYGPQGPSAAQPPPAAPTPPTPDPNALPVINTQPAAAAPSPDPTSQWAQQTWAQPPENPLAVKPAGNVQMGSGPVQYDTGPHRVGTILPYGESNELGGGGTSGESAISGFVSQMESGGGKLAQLNLQRNPHMIDGTYGQYPEFVSDYGRGQQGVDNYAAKVLASNPNATLGDFYSSYVLNTGDPTKLSTPDQLKTKQPLYYANFQHQLAAHGYSFDTPLSSLVGSQQGNQQAVGVSAGGEVIYAPAPPTQKDWNQPLQVKQDYSKAPGEGDVPEAQQNAQQAQADAKKQMMQMMMLAALRGWALTPVPYDPAAILKLSRSQLYGDAQTRMTGLPDIGRSAIPRLGLAQEVTATSPRMVPGRLEQKGPPQ